MKRFLFLLSAIVIANVVIMGQNHAQYNSLCIYDNTSDASLYTCASVDSITFEQHDGVYCQVVWRDGNASVSPVSAVDSISFYNPYVEGIVEINEGFDIWDKAYVTPIGYFSYKSALVDDGEDLESELYETLAYANFEDTQTATLILSKNDSLPVWFMVDSLTCTFGYLPEDSLCQLTIGCDSAVVCELELMYNDSIVSGSNQYTDHELKRCLWIITSLLDGNTAACQPVTDIVAKFKTLLTIGEEDTEPKLPKKPISKKLKVKVNVYYGVGAGTYGAYYITSSSAVLQGCVYCASAQRDSASVYGILCDENPENLTIEKAKHNIVGQQERMRLRYEVQATELKPNTTYYYRAYVRIKKGKNDLQYSYAGDKAANAAYGKVRKFKTYSFPGKISKIEVVGSGKDRPSDEPLKDRYMELEVAVSFENIAGVSDWCVYQQIAKDNYKNWAPGSYFEIESNGVMTFRRWENFFIPETGESTLTIDYSKYIATGTCTLGIAVLRIDPLTKEEYWEFGDSQYYELIYDKKPKILFTDLDVSAGMEACNARLCKDKPLHYYYSGEFKAYSDVVGSIFIDKVYINNSIGYGFVGLGYCDEFYPYYCKDVIYVNDYPSCVHYNAPYYLYHIMMCNGKELQGSNVVIVEYGNVYIK